MDSRIVCAAIRAEGIVIIGARHFDSLMNDAIDRFFNPDEFLQLQRLNKVEQGFIDQYRNFYNRAEAKKIAEAQGQIIRSCGGDFNELFSENLY